MIGAVTSSSSSRRIVFEVFPSGLSRCGTEIFCLVPRKTFNVECLRFDSAQNRILKPLRSSFSFRASQVDLIPAETKTQEKYPTKTTVHVRFQLQKECAFGEHFFILGDDPVFGLWDPENAIPLNWSDGHVWIVDLDLPIGKSIEFKFILKGKTGTISWQPGQNRVLETWETNNTITICEDWENADLQRIFEEEHVLVNQKGPESSFVNLDMPIVAENVSSTDSKVKVELNMNNPSVAERKAEVLGTSIQENPAIVAENVGYIKDDSEARLSSDVQNERKLECPSEPLAILDENGTGVVMVNEDEGPVLVRGLTPESVFEKEDVTGGRDEETSIAHAVVEVINEVETDNSPEVDMITKQESEGERKQEGEEREVTVVERHGLEKDIEWGRRTLNKLLNSFRLL